MVIREATANDIGAVWEIFSRVIQTGDTYAFSPETTEAELPALWFAPAMKTFVAEDSVKITATYFIKPNQPGLGSHVANCGYMVHPEAQGRGIGKALFQHSLAVARELGYRAMQFNFVVSTNTTAVQLWQKMGFDIIGTIPDGFRHNTLGFTDVYIMFKKIT